MFGVVDARGVSRRVQWRWRDVIGPALLVWTCLMGLMVYFDARLVRLALESARRAAVLTLPDGTHPRSYSWLLLALSLGIHGLMVVVGTSAQLRAAMSRLVKRRSGASQCPG